MFKLIHAFFNNALFSKPTIQHFQPKVLNVKFNESLSPSFVSLNLTRISRLSLNIEQRQSEESKIHVLACEYETEGKTEKIELASFETKQEAEYAMIVLQNKLSSPEKALVKTFMMFMALIFALSFLSVLYRTNFTSSEQRVSTGAPISQMELLKQLQAIRRSQLGTQNGTQNGTPTSNNDFIKQQLAEQAAMMKAREKADKIIQEGMREQSPSQAPAPVVSVPQDPKVKSFINQLK